MLEEVFCCLEEMVLAIHLLHEVTANSNNYYRCVHVFHKLPRKCLLLRFVSV